MVDTNSRMLIVSGKSASGKTSACYIAAQAQAEACKPLGGVLCRAVFEDGGKTGISCQDLSLGLASEQWLMATINQQHKPSRTPPQFNDTDPFILRFGMWQFFKAALARADEAVIHYLNRPGKDGEQRATVFIDEIGPMELDRNLGMVRTLARLDAIALGDVIENTACIVVARPIIASHLASRWPKSSVLDIEGMSIAKAAEEISRLMLW